MSIAPLPVGTPLRPDGHNFRYEVEELLGTGGFGHTYLARDRNLNRLVAVKELAFAPYCYRDTQRFVVVVHGGREERFVRLKEKFVQEAQKVAAIQEASDHPNIIRVHDVWEERGTAYYSMDYIRSSETFGEDRMLDVNGKVRWGVVEDRARQLLSGIDAVHTNGMFHGDLKPDNVLVTDNGQVKILDFGTAKREEDLSNPVTSLAYSLGYAPVELMDPSRVREIGPWTDIYSIGMILVGATLGHGGEDGTPFDPAVRKQSAKGDPYDSISTRLVEAGVPTIWANAIERMIEVEPTNRFSNVKDVIAAVTGSASTRPRPAASNTTPADARSKTVVQNIPASFAAGSREPVAPARVTTSHSDRRGSGGLLPLMIGVLLLIVAGLALAVFQPWKSDDDSNDEEEHIAAADEQDEDENNDTDEDVRTTGTSATTLGVANTDAGSTGNARNTEVTSCLDSGCSAGTCSNGVCVPDGFYYFAGGRLAMGRSDNGQPFGSSDERSVMVDVGPFAMAEHEVTNAQWRSVFGNSPSFFADCESCPVESVNWYESLAYLNRLSTRENLDECYVLNGCTGSAGEGCNGAGACNGSYRCSEVRWNADCDGYRLPTEREWEYAARTSRGEIAPPCVGANCHPSSAWYSDNSERKTHPVGTAGSTDRPVDDLFGNVCEWVWDSYEEIYPANVPTSVRDLSSPVSRRGGGFIDGAEHLRATNRMYNDRSARSGHTGFRVVTSKQFAPN